MTKKGKPDTVPPLRSQRRLEWPVTVGSGSRGEQVRKVQVLLTERGFFDGDADGRFGVRLTHAVRQFQASVGLRISGDVNATTWEALNEA